MASSSGKKVFSTALMATCAMIVLSACASSNQGFLNNAPETKNFNIPTFDPLSYDAKQEGKRFAPEIREETFSVGDVATVAVNGFKEFSGTYTVSKDGKIYFGHIEDVYVQGLTIPEVQLKLRDLYGACCLVNPNVSVEREGQEFGRIVVDGAVNDAGVFEINEVIKLSEAVALAGGISEIANPEMTILSREINGERKISNINLTEIRMYGANDPMVYPNDVVYIQDSKGRLLYKDFVKTLPLVSALIFAASR